MEIAAFVLSESQKVAVPLCKLSVPRPTLGLTQEGNSDTAQTLSTGTKQSAQPGRSTSSMLLITSDCPAIYPSWPYRLASPRDDCDDESVGGFVEFVARVSKAPHILSPTPVL